VSDIVTRAVNLAFDTHAGQTRKHGVKLPYVVHPIRVALRVARLPGATDEMVAAAALHDVLEDTNVEREEIEAFGPIVTELVSELTNTTKGLPHSRAHRKKLDRERLAGTSLEARVIKLVDRIDNLSEMWGAPLEYLRMYAGESLLLLEALGSVGTEYEYLRDELRQLALAIHKGA